MILISSKHSDYSKCCQSEVFSLIQRNFSIFPFYSYTTSGINHYLPIPCQDAARKINTLHRVNSHRGMIYRYITNSLRTVLRIYDVVRCNIAGINEEQIDIFQSRVRARCVCGVTAAGPRGARGTVGRWEGVCIGRCRPEHVTACVRNIRENVGVVISAQ